MDFETLNLKNPKQQSQNLCDALNFNLSVLRSVTKFLAETLSSFHLKRNSVWYKLKADKEEYLIFKDEEKGFTLKQYALGDWENEKIDELFKEWEPAKQKSELAAV